MQRLYNLDYLRGLAALGIMIYHYTSFGFGKFSADSFMSRLGIYGVSIFYILSGLTLYYVYFDKLKPSKIEFISFFNKRIFRIFPLLWLVTIIGIIFSKKLPDMFDVFLNLSGLFGFIKWDTYFSAGIWSIGNELVFYVFFPFFILFTKSYKPLMYILTLIIFSLYLYYAFVVLNKTIPLSEQWRNYVNPLNQVFLFLGGFLIGLILHSTKVKTSITITLFILGLSLFIFYPVTGNAIKLVTGVNRLFFTTCCFLICTSFYKMTFTFPNFIHKPLTLIGEISYSVYLLHPIIYYVITFLKKILMKKLFYIPESISIIISVLTTLLISYFIYQYFEKYFIKLARRNKTE